MRGKLNWAVAPLASKGSWNFISSWKEREGAHSTRLRNHKSKWYRFEAARGCSRSRSERRRERVRECVSNKRGRGEAAGGLLRAVRSINGSRFGPCRTTDHGGS